MVARDEFCCSGKGLLKTARRTDRLASKLGL